MEGEQGTGTRLRSGPGCGCAQKCRGKKGIACSQRDGCRSGQRQGNGQYQCSRGTEKVRRGRAGTVQWLPGPARRTCSPTATASAVVLCFLAMASSAMPSSNVASCTSSVAPRAALMVWGKSAGHGIWLTTLQGDQTGIKEALGTSIAIVKNSGSTVFACASKCSNTY